MWSKLIESSPYLAGYFSILVNVNDIIVKGGRPVAVLNMMASSSERTRSEMFKGITDGCKKFKVPMVGGHLHPDSENLELAVSILGIVKKKEVIYSDGASINDEIIVGIDLDGSFHPKFIYAWDTTTKKNSAQVFEKYEAIWKIAKHNLASACKDISNPGVIGTLGMLLDASEKGGKIELDKIPMPKNVELEQWLRAYPGFGVVLTTSNSSEVLKIMKDVNISASVIGKVTNTNKLLMTDKHEELEVFDFEQVSLSGKLRK